MKKTWLMLLDVILKNFPKVALGVLLMVAGFLAFSFYQDKLEAERRHEELLGKTQDYEQISDSLAQLKTEYANQREIWDRAKRDWSSERKRLKGKIKALADAAFSGGSDETTEKTDKLYAEALFCCSEDGPNDGKGPAVSKTRFEALPDDKGWVSTSKVLDHELHIKAAITKDERSGRISILTKGYWVQKEEAENDFWLNKPYPLSITGGSLVIDPTDKKWELERKFRLAPHLNLGGSFIVVSEATTGVYLGMSLGGYGVTNNDLDFKLVSLGLNFGEEYLDFNFVPVTYRVGNHLPFVKDLYLGPGIGKGSDGTSYFLVLETTL